MCSILFLSSLGTSSFQNPPQIPRDSQSNFQATSFNPPDEKFPTSGDVYAIQQYPQQFGFPHFGGLPRRRRSSGVPPPSGARPLASAAVTRLPSGLHVRVPPSSRLPLPLHACCPAEAPAPPFPPPVPPRDLQTPFPPRCPSSPGAPSAARRPLAPPPPSARRPRLLPSAPPRQPAARPPHSWRRGPAPPVASPLERRPHSPASFWSCYLRGSPGHLLDAPAGGTTHAQTPYSAPAAAEGAGPGLPEVTILPRGVALAGRGGAGGRVGLGGPVAAVRRCGCSSPP